MSRDIEIDPDPRTIKYYEKPDVGSIREDIMMGARIFKTESVMVLLDEIDRIQKLIPPDPERGPGFVSQGSRSVFAEKVVEERDELRIEVQNLRAWVDIADKVADERDAAREGMKQLLEEKIEFRDELSYLCEEIRCLKEENDELQEEVKKLGAQLAAKKEHTSVDTDGDEPLEISGYGKFRLIRTTADYQWMLFLNKENIMLYNRNGKRVRAKFTEW
jgi:predicted RNase H-like nuclease (RuvC/YqgF family)